MKSIRALIVDDEPLARERIRTLLSETSYVDVIGECENGQSAIHAIAKQQPDLLFLDVQMPELDGFAVLEAIAPHRMPVVIFVTAYDRYALRAFDVHALDYLLKPFDRERFYRALDRARGEIERRNEKDLSHRIVELLKDLKDEQRFLERLVIKSAGRVFFLRADEIDWIEAAANYVRLHVGKEAHLLREKMNTLEKRLDQNRFLRIHRSTIVNIERIKELHPGFRGEYVVTLHSGQRLTLSRGYRDKLQDLLGKPL